MSLAMAFWYQGIIKPEFRPQVQKCYQSGFWRCAEPPLGNLLQKAFGETAPPFMTPDSRWLPMPENWNAPEYGDAPSFDKETGLLRYFVEWNHYSTRRRTFEKLEHVILPYLTKQLISFHGWTEPMAETDSDSVTDMTAVFLRDQEHLSGTGNF